MQKNSCSIKGIVQQLLSYKKAVILGNMIALISTLLIVIIPLFIPVLVDELLLGQEHGFIAWISKTFLLLIQKGMYFLF